MSSGQELWSRRAFGLGLLAACGVAFGASNRGLLRLLPLDVPVIGPKLRHFRSHLHGYTLIALGTGHVYRGFVPRAFDAALGARGIESKSFNFGVPRLTLPEASRLVDEIIASRPRRLRWVALEMGLFTDQEAAHSLSARDVWWRPGDLGEAVVKCAGSAHPFSESMAGARHAFDATLLNVTPVGRISRRFRHSWEADLVNEDPIVALGDEGYRALEDLHDSGVLERRRRFLGDTLAFERSIEARRLSGGRVPLSDAERTTLEHIAGRLRARGITTLFVDLPSAEPTLDPAPLRAFGHPLAVNDPRELPELFHSDRFFDHGHVNRWGAVALSELLARRFAPVA